jgi:ABC-type transport system involved in cytochrome bd biosynthesis fused ATPase/permease subunit
MFLPRALSAAADAVNAVERLEHLFEAETQAPSRTIESGQDLAIRMENASFTWLAAAPEKIEKKSKAQKQKSQNEAGAGTASPISAEPFSISGLNLRVAKGSLVAVVGAVGSGKSSILSGLIGEMKHLSGHVSFGGKISYCPQDAFIQNCTLRDNVLFGQPFDEERYWQVLSDASLIQDCLLLPDGDLTEIGEKGITISGGQKQRINVARCLYHQSDIYIYDDPLSALDAHVGQAIFDNAMLKAVQAGKTVLLVTHALHIRRWLFSHIHHC